MPYKELIAISLVVVTGWYITGGQKSVHRNLRKIQVTVLRDLGNTRKWGNPTPWSYRGPVVFRRGKFYRD
jgi:hypothetical protein